MDDALDDRRHEFGWATYCDEYDDVRTAIDVLRAQRKYSVFVTSLHPCTSLSEEQSTAVRALSGHCLTRSLVI